MPFSLMAEFVFECDFRERSGGIKGSVALDLDERFAGWKFEFMESVVIRHMEVWELLNCLIVYEC